MAKRKTVAAKRREALVQKKIEKKRGTRSVPERGEGVLLKEQLEEIGFAGGYLGIAACDSTNDFLKTLSQSMIAKELGKTTSILQTPTFRDNPEEWLNRLFLPKDLPFVITADEQTAGRGRQNNTWWTGHGSLALSMLLDAKKHGLTPQTSAQLSLAIGYAAMTALRAITEETLAKSKTATKIESNGESDLMPNIEIRWPNDVYVNDRKIVGILIEAPNMRHLVIGIGINTNNTAADAPEEIRERIVTLRDVLGQEIDQRRMIFLLCREIMAVLQYFPLQLPQFIEQVEQNLHQVGKMVNISREGDTISGQCLGLNSDGSLRVLTETGEKAVVSGVTI